MLRLHQGWAAFLRQLEYKMLWGRWPVPRRASAEHLPDMPVLLPYLQGQSEMQAAFACVKCDVADNADLVGAINV